jgi:hypothetical protein
MICLALAGGLRRVQKEGHYVVIAIGIMVIVHVLATLRLPDIILPTAGPGKSLSDCLLMLHWYSIAASLLHFIVYLSTLAASSSLAWPLVPVSGRLPTAVSSKRTGGLALGDGLLRGLSHAPLLAQLW